MNGCTFCDEIRNEAANLFYDTIGERTGVKSRILFQDKNWLVIPTMGSFTLGYLLIVSREHYLSIANFPIKLYLTFEKLLNRIGAILKEQFGCSYIAFEHGATTTEYRLSCCVDHMHLHIIPFKKDIWNNMVQEYNFEYSEIANYSDIKIYIQKNNIKSYLLFQNIDQRKYIIDSTSNIYPSQFFRQIISREIDIDLQWDWRHHFYEDNIIRTIELSGENHWFD